jgi:phosphoenolpyruvate carboxylase
LLKIARQDELMQNYPDGKASVATREKIVRPLLVIQQYALQRISALEQMLAQTKA